MCGIAGLCGFHSTWQEDIQKMNNKMISRGPDSEGIWHSEKEGVTLGHRRLSIVDLSETGNQPMLSKDGRFVIAINGEIYNYRDIKKQLIVNKNVTFNGSSDTEILLEAFANWGIEETLDVIKGMYAIALYDIEMKKLYLIRDRMGEKPLYYGYVKGIFAFASDVACMKEITGFNNEIDMEALALFFKYSYIPTPYSIYKNICKLDPGSYLEIPYPFKEYTIKKYWDLKVVAKKNQRNLFKGTYSEASEELERLLRETIKREMVADVPVGAFLSGGIDSSTIVSLMQDMNASKINTFTIGFCNPQYNEAEVANKIAKHLGTSHTELYVDEKTMKEVIPLINKQYGEPFADSSQIPTYLVSNLAKSKVTVSLSGDGGDELFCGYDRYIKFDNIWKNVEKVPFEIRKLIGEIGQNNLFRLDDRIGRYAKYLTCKSSEELFAQQANCNIYNDKILLKKCIMTECAYDSYMTGYLDGNKNNYMLMELLMELPDDILTKVDRAAMAVSLESRVPFMDNAIVEFAWSLPLTYKINGDIKKRILRNVLYKYVPQELVDTPKRGFCIPIKEWLKEGELREWAEELLNSSRIKEQGILDYRIIEKVWGDYINRDVWRSQIWYILMFQNWYNNI